MEKLLRKKTYARKANSGLKRNCKCIPGAIY